MTMSVDKQVEAATVERRELAAVALLTVIELFDALTGAARQGVQWLRVMVGARLGLEPEQCGRTWAQSAAYAEIETALALVLQEVCQAGCERTGKAHTAMFRGLRTTINNAFPNALAPSTRVRFSDTRTTPFERNGDWASDQSLPWVTHHRQYSTKSVKGGEVPLLVCASIAFRAKVTSSPDDVTTHPEDVPQLPVEDAHKPRELGVDPRPTKMSADALAAENRQLRECLSRRKTARETWKEAYRVARIARRGLNKAAFESGFAAGKAAR